MKKWPTFICSYRYKGATWDIDLPAEDWDDARARLSVISMGKVEGPLAAKIPANRATGVLVRMIIRLRNLLN